MRVTQLRITDPPVLTCMLPFSSQKRGKESLRLVLHQLRPIRTASRSCQFRGTPFSWSSNSRVQPDRRRGRCKFECGCTRTSHHSSAVPWDPAQKAQTDLSSAVLDRDSGYSY